MLIGLLALVIQQEGDDEWCVKPLTRLNDDERALFADRQQDGSEIVFGWSRNGSPSQASSKPYARLLKLGLRR